MSLDNIRSLKSLLYSISVSPSLMYILELFLMIARVRIGSMLGSSSSWTFSTIKTRPFCRQERNLFSNCLSVKVDVSRSWYFLLSYLAACSCGSMMRGHRAAFSIMAAFSFEKRSSGKSCPAHSAMVAPSTNSVRGSIPSLYGTPNFWIDIIQSFFQMRSRNLRS